MLRDGRAEVVLPDDIEIVSTDRYDTEIVMTQR